MSFFSRYWLIFAALFMVIFTLISVFSHPKPTLTEPALRIGISPFKQAIAGIGIVEPQSEIIAIGTTIPGIISQIYVHVGQKVKANEALFTIDSRDATARYNAENARLDYAKAALEESKNQLKFYENVGDKRAISAEEITQRKDKVALATARVNEVQASLNVIAMEIERLTVKSPIDANILKISTHLGEYAPTGILKDPLIIEGQTDLMHVRVEVDESNAQGFSPKAKAVGFLRGYNPEQIPLVFVRVEPLLTSKKSLSNQGNELVDTRVLVVIYSFNNKNVNAYNGQQMDVYIDHEEKPVVPK